MFRIILVLFVLALAGNAFAWEKVTDPELIAKLEGYIPIKGQYCYTYGDNESLTSARDTAKNLAIRNAIESHSSSIDSRTVVENSALSSDVVRSIANGNIKLIKSISHTENGRTICDTVTAYATSF